MVYAVSLLMPNSSATNLSVSRQSRVSICRTFSYNFWGSGSMADLNVAHPQSFPSLREPFVNTFSAHGLSPVHLHQHSVRLRCSFPQFVAERDVCLLLHCAVTLPLTLTTFNWPQSVYTASHMQSMLCVDSPMSPKNHAHARTRAPSCRSDMIPFTELFRHTL